MCEQIWFQGIRIGGCPSPLEVIRHRSKHRFSMLQHAIQFNRKAKTVSDKVCVTDTSLRDPRTTAAVDVFLNLVEVSVVGQCG